MKTRKVWWRSRTLRLNALAAALFVLEARFNVLQPLLPVDFYSAASVALAVVNAALRVITNSGLAFRKEES